MSAEKETERAVGLFTFAEFSAWTAFAAILAALILPLVLDGFRPHTVLLNYFHVMFGAVGWKLVGPTSAHQESANPSPPHGEQLQGASAPATPTPTETNSNEIP